MDNTPIEKTVRPAKRRRWGMWLAIIFGILVVLVVVAFFVATSSAFFKGVVLPRVSQQLDADVTVADASISPFSEVILHGIKVHPHGREPLLEAAQARARYSLWDIIHGKIVVHELTLDSPVVTIFQNADGTSNLDPLTKKGEAKPGEQKPAATKPEEKKATKPAEIDIKNVSLKNARIEVTKNLAGGGREVTEISGFDLTLDQLQNGQSGKLNFGGNLKIDRTPGTESKKAATENVAAGSLEAKLSGAFNFKLATNLAPETAQGNSRVDILKATGEMSDLAALAAMVNCDLTPTEIRNLNLRFEQNGNALGEMRASGPFSAETKEGRLKVDLSSIDRRVLNLVGAPRGIDFNGTKINSSNEIDLQQKGTLIAINGEFGAADFSLTQKAKNQTTPVLNLKLAYQLNVDQNNKSALIQKFDLSGEQNQKNILRASLSKPMPLSWGGGAGAPEEADFDLAITGLNLADWKTFAADLAPAGLLDATLHVVSRQSGKQLLLDLNSQLADFSARFGSNQISRANINLSAKGQVDDLKKINLSEYRLQLAQENQTAISVSGAGNVNAETKEADLKTLLEANLPQLLRIAKIADLTADSGTIRFDGRVVQTKEAQSLTGKFALSDLSGTYAKTRIDRMAADFDADVAVQNQELQIRKASGAIQQAGQPGGNFDLSGTYNLTSKAGQIEMKLADLNQNALAPFVSSALGGKQLVSVSINANTTAKLDPSGASIFKGDLAVTNLVVRDPKQPAAELPLSAQFKVDGALQKQVLDLKQFQIALSPTDRAKNELNLKGQVDFSQTNAIKANLTAQSDSLDVTPFYDLYAGGTKETATAHAPTKPSAAPAPAPASANEEPEPVKLPIQQAMVDLNIGKFYLRQIEITNLQSKIKIEGSHVVLNPFQLTLNNGPVKGSVDLDLGVKGYVYDLSFTMDKVPLQPIADSLMPDKAGAYQGLILADAKLKGAGITGISLQKNLSGQANFSFTNANIKLSGNWLRPFLQAIALALQTPELTESPLTALSADLKMGQGAIDVQQFKMLSPTFSAVTQGKIPIAPVLMNSPLNLPMSFSLSQPLAKRVPYLSNLAQTNGAYVELPQFVKVSGTLGKPKAKIDIFSMKTIAPILQGIAPKEAQPFLKGLGGILGGKTNSSGTNPPSQPGAGVNQLFDLFKKQKK